MHNTGKILYRVMSKEGCFWDFTSNHQGIDIPVPKEQAKQNCNSCGMMWFHRQLEPGKVSQVIIQDQNLAQTKLFRASWFKTATHGHLRFFIQGNYGGKCRLQ